LRASRGLLTLIGNAAPATLIVALGTSLGVAPFGDVLADATTDVAGVALLDAVGAAPDAAGAVLPDAVGEASAESAGRVAGTGALTLGVAGPVAAGVDAVGVTTDTCGAGGASPPGSQNTAK
jgi:hypothetical protein